MTVFRWLFGGNAQQSMNTKQEGMYYMYDSRNEMRGIGVLTKTFGRFTGEKNECFPFFYCYHCRSPCLFLLVLPSRQLVFLRVYFFGSAHALCATALSGHAC